MKNTCTLIGWLLALTTQAQTTGSFSFQYDQRPPVTVDGRTVPNPWAGGLNSVQYSTMRLNDDPRDDLVVFDRTNDKISTFVAVDNPAGGVRWQYAPEYETAFPAVYNWMLLVDYDSDGRKDLFMQGIGSVQLYRNESQAGKVAFRLAKDQLYTEGFGGPQPVYVNSQDIPSITDYDDDGDIDIITFDAGGNLVAYQQNMSVERTGKKDGLDFKRSGGSCWGHFSKEFCNDFIFGVQCDDASGGRIAPVQKEGSQAGAGARPLHSGNTLTVLDVDGDGNKDLLFGFVTCENIALLRNGGPNSDKANFVGFDSLFPARNPIVFPAFPATFVEDVDGDGLKDLLASPNVSSNENQAFDFRASNWYYKNVGTSQKPDYQLAQKDFLQSDMLDLGESATPALGDLDGDGDLDLLIGYAGVSTPAGYRSGVWQFENKGTLQSPAFTLVTTDYLGIAQTLGLTYVTPSFADVDGNGRVDLIVTGTSARAVEIRVFFNTAAPGTSPPYSLSAATRWPTPDLVGPGDLLTMADVDRDGKADVLVGKSSDGTVDYFRNAGTAAVPIFERQNQNFGGFTGDDYTRARSLVVADLNGDRKNELIASDNNGKVRIYQFPDRIDQPALLLDSLPAIGLPGTKLVATAADLDGDQLPDLMLGTLAGGVRYLRNTSPKIVVTGTPEPVVNPWAFPNPADRYLTIRPPYAGRIELMSLTGQVVFTKPGVRAGAETVIDLGSLAAGTYLLRLSADGRPTRVQKVLIGR